MAPRADRRALPMSEWPPSDRDGWRQAIASAQGFDEPGAAAHLAEVSRSGTASAWGRYLTFLEMRGWLAPDEGLRSRAASDKILAYRDWLEDEVHIASISIWGEINRLHLFVRAISPYEDWSRLRQFVNCLHAQMERKISVVDKLLSPEELRHVAYRNLCEIHANTMLRPKLKASRFRDWLLIAMLACWPLRLRNIAELRIGTHLVRDTRSYLAAFKGNEVKNRKRLEWRYPDDLTPWIDLYLEKYRPALAGDGRTDRFWIRQDGGVFTPDKLLLRLSRVTKRAFGVSFTTRFFRYSGATAIFERAPEETGLASALLGHKSLSTARRHYIHPATNLALKRHADLILKLGQKAKVR